MSDQIAASGLESLALSDIAHVEMGQSPDSRFVVEDHSVGLAFLQGNAEFGAVNPEPKFGCLRPAKTCKANDVLISVRAPVGAVNLADRDYCIGRGLAAVRGRGIKPSLLGEVVARQSSALRRVAQGTTFEAISKNDLLTLKLSLPPKTDWPKIAQILDTLNIAIRETEAIIDKLKAVKQGLLHDLLTRGIDANGELRPPQSEAPQRYKESPLGWIPNEWDACELNTLVDPARPVVYGILMPGYGYPGGVPVVKVKDIVDDSIQLENLLLTSPQIDREYSRSRLRPGDLLFTIRGTVGRMAIVTEQLNDANITQDTARLAIKFSDARFVKACLSMHAAARFIAVNTLGVAVQGINLRDVRRIPLPRPGSGEAREIADRLDRATQRLAGETRTLKKLTLAKAGLMDDLLTGLVRVTPLLAEVEREKECA